MPLTLLWALMSHFQGEGDSFLLSVRTVGIMLPLSEVERTASQTALFGEFAYHKPRRWFRTLLDGLTVWW